MSLFRKIKKDVSLAAPVNGRMIDTKSVPDAMFSQEMLGPTLAFRSDEGRIYAPVDGKVVMLMDSKHAVGIRDACDNEYLIHIGIDTVNLQGTGFKAHVRKNSRVRKGDLLVEYDIKTVEEAGYDQSIMIVVSKLALSSIERKTVEACRSGDTVALLKA